jgi:hypothetical protein
MKPPAQFSQGLFPFTQKVVAFDFSVDRSPATHATLRIELESLSNPTPESPEATILVIPVEAQRIFELWDKTGKLIAEMGWQRSTKT